MSETTDPIISLESREISARVQFWPSQDFQGDNFQIFCKLQQKNNSTKQCALCSRVRDAYENEIYRKFYFSCLHNCSDWDVALSVNPCFPGIQYDNGHIKMGKNYYFKIWVILL